MIVYVFECKWMPQIRIHTCAHAQVEVKSATVVRYYLYELKSLYKKNSHVL